MSARSQSQAQSELSSQVATQTPPAAFEGAALQRQCAGGCGTHTVAGGVCADCRQQRPATPPPSSTLKRSAVNRVESRRPTPASLSETLPSSCDTAREDARPDVQVERDFTGVRTTAGRINIKDEDPARAEATRRLLERLAHQLGIDTSRLDIRTDAEAARHTSARGAGGLMDGGIVYLDPRRYDPRTREGAYLIGHEAVHVAQRANAHERRSASKALLAEIEADELGRAFADGQLIERPKAGLPVSYVAADVDMDALDALAAQNHKGELARIHALLQRGFLDWAITDGDITEILTILSLFPFVTARSLVNALPDEDQYRLIDNLDTAHYKPFRSQIIAAYWGTKTDVLKKFGANLFTPLDLHDLDPLEIHAIKNVFDRLDAPSQSKLREDAAVGPVIAEIEVFMSATSASTESVVEAVNRALSKALKSAFEEETKLADERASALSTFAEHWGDLRKTVDEIKTRMSKFWVSDQDALDVLDMLAEKYSSQPEMMRAIAERLVVDKSPPEHAPHEYQEKDYLDELIRQTPIEQLYTEGARRKVFLQLLSFRPPHKNEAIAEELMSAWLPVTAEEGYLAFMLVKSMPERARAAFYKSENGKNWAKIFSEMSLQMRESETLNLYAGGEADKDRNSILIQLLSDEIWNNPDTSRLDALVRMAIAAGEHEFVFEQSRQRESYLKDNDKLKTLVEKYKLYNPNEKRFKYAPEKLDEDSDPSVLWGLLRFLFGSDSIYISRIFGGVEAGGKGLNLEAAQDIIGGSLKGVRLSTPDQRAKRNGNGAKNEQGINRADANYLEAEGFAEVHADQLDIAAIHFPSGDTKLQTGTGTMRNLNLRIRASASGFALPSMVDLHASELVLHDVLIIKPDSMKGINTFDMRGLSLVSGQVGSEFDRIKGSRGASGTPVPVFAGMIYVMHLAPGSVITDGEINKGGRPDAPSLPLEFDLSFDSIKLIGVTTSGGAFIESVEIKDLSLRGGGDVNAYRKALNASAERLAERLKKENAAFDAAQSPLDMSTHADAAAQLQKQLDRTRTELERLTKDEAEVKRLEELQKSDPGSFSPADRIKLRKLKAALSGATLDASSIVIKGVAGYEDAGADGETSKREIKLTDVHGQGRAATSALGLLGDPDQLRSLIGGESARPTYKGEGTDQPQFTLDIGHFEVPNRVLKGEIPTGKVAERDYQKFEANHDPWRPSHVKELDRLKKRCDYAIERDKLLQDVGLRKFNETQRKRFSELTKNLDELEKQGAITVGLISMEGMTLGFGTGERITVNASKFKATDIRKGATHVDALEGENVQIDVDVTEGLTGLDKWRDNLQKLSLKGDSLVATGITNEDMGLVIDRASLLGIDEASLDNKDKNASARLKTKMVLIEGVHLKNIEDALIREENYLKRLYATPSKTREERLQSITKSLDELKDLRTALGKAEAKLAAAKTKQGKLAAQAVRDEAQKKIDSWAEKLITERVAVTGTDVTLSGLGNILSPDWDLDKVLEKGIQLDGKMDDISVENLLWQDASRRIQSTGKISLTGIKAVGAFYSKKQIKVASLIVDSFTGDNLSYSDRATGMDVTVKSGGLGGIKINNLTVNLPQKEGEEVKISGGKVSVDKVNKLSLGLKLLSKGIQGGGVLDGSDLSVDFVTANKRVYHVGDLSLSADPEARQKKGEKLPPNILLTFKKFSAKAITDEKLEGGGRRLTFEDIKLADFAVGNARFSGGGKRIEINGLASLSGLSFTAEVILDKDNNVKQLTAKRLYVKEIGATGIHVEKDAVAPDPAKPGDKGAERTAIDLASGKIKELEINDFDLNKMVGTIAVKDAVEIDKLRVAVGAKGEESLKASISLKAFGKGKKEGPGEEGLRGRELKATLMGANGHSIDLGTFKEISGDLESLIEGEPGAKKGKVSTGFGTGRLTVGTIIISGDGTTVTIPSIEIKDVSLKTPTFTDGKGTTIKLKENVTVPLLKVEKVVATFGVLSEEKGKQNKGMTSLNVTNLDFGTVTAKGFLYDGAATISDGITSTTKVEAASVVFEGFCFNSLSHNFKDHITKLDARLKKTVAKDFVTTFTDKLGDQTAQTQIFGDIEAGSMSAGLTLTGTKAYGKDWTSIDGFFQLDTNQKLGLTNMRVVETVNGAERMRMGALDPSKALGIDLTGLKVKFAPNGTFLVSFDELAAKNLKIRKGRNLKDEAEPSTVMELPLAKLKGAAIALQGLGMDEGIKLLGGKFSELGVENVRITHTVDRNPGPYLPDAFELKKPPKPPEPWVLEPLRDMTGDLMAFKHNVAKVKGAAIPVQIRAGIVDFNNVKGITSRGSLSVDFGIDPNGIYHSYEPLVGKEYDYESNNIPGATFETVRPDGKVTDYGQLNLHDFLEGKMNAPPPTTPSLSPVEPLASLNDLQLFTTRDLALGAGKLGTKKNHIELAQGTTSIAIRAARVGNDLLISFPEGVNATRGVFEFGFKGETHKGETGAIEATNVNLAITGLGNANMRFTIRLEAQTGKINAIKFGDVSMTSESALRKRAAPPKEKEK